MENVVTVIFSQESEAYQALTEIRNAPVGEGYVVPEAALVKHEGDQLILADGFDTGVVTEDDTATGIIVGSLVGILGGPLGVLMGAGIGALAGSALDSSDSLDIASMLEVTALKLYEGETAIIALVEEDEPAFDAAFDKYEVTIIRHYAVDVANEVNRARELEAEVSVLVKEQLRKEHKAERQEKRDERAAAYDARVNAVKAKGSEAFSDMRARKQARRERAADALDSTVNAIDNAADKLPDFAKKGLGFDN